METWIINENDQVTTCLRKSLRDAGIDCPPERVVDTYRAATLTSELPCVDRTFFLVTDEVQSSHVHLLQELQAACEAKVVVVSTVTDSGTILSLFRAGVNDMLSGDQDISTEIPELIKRLRAESSRKRGNGKVITVVPSGQTGDSSLLSVNLAGVLAGITEDCGLVDLHLRGGDLAAMLKLEPPHTLHALLTQKDDFDETMIDQAIAKHSSGISLLASPQMFSHLGNIESHACQVILQYLKSSRPCTVINSEDVVHAEQLRALALSDAIILTTRLDIVSVYRAKETLRYLLANHIDQASLHIVAMCTGNPSELPAKSVSKLLDIPELHCVPDDPTSTIISLNIGNPVVFEFPQSSFARSVQSLAMKLPTLSELMPDVSNENRRVRDITFGAIGELFLPRRKVQDVANPVH
ncbi:AAA family ATPase [Neorhodopirellula lusitana]|uniref:AAA family ATPase n=1 Tax=Neorhodopirellula lusitana TaxID=445327 RepID=UPI00384F99C3